MRAWNWFMRLLFGPARTPLNEKLWLVIAKDRGTF